MTTGGTLARRRSDLWTRVASGVALIAVALSAVALGGMWFWVLVVIAALLMAAEWAGLMHASRRGIWAAVIGAAVPLGAAYPGLGLSQELILVALVAGAVIAGLASLRPSLGAGVLYVGLPSLALLQLRWQPDGPALTLWTLAIVWATDIGAYFFGRAIGGPKLAPRLSPNKTWAGLLGGMASALVLGIIAGRLVNLPWLLVSLGALLAVLAQAGDLFESWLKRRAGVKDSGRILPGHGGVLDRLDGVVPVATVVACLIAFGWI